MYRNEFWYVLEGDIMIELEFGNQKEAIYLTAHDTYTIPDCWHKTTNIGKKTSTYIRSAIWR